jgi:membrane-bound lytic murein transglycosylase A
VRATNRSYVFFRVSGLSNEGEPTGAQGVPLTPGRSIAVDRMHEYGTPFFIEANLPIESGKSVSPFRRLMIAQDTGSAIVGPARADLYLGGGGDAGRIAGRIRHPARFVMLLPREVVLAASAIPLPTPKPQTAALEVAKKDGESAGSGAIAASRKAPSPQTKVVAIQVKEQVKEQDRRGRANSAEAAAIATGRQEPLLGPKPRIVVIEASTDGKGKAESAGTNAAAIAAGRQMPLPVPKPKISAIEARKQGVKSKVDSVGAAATDSKQKPPPMPKSKPPGIEAKGQNKGQNKTQNAKGKAEAQTGNPWVPRVSHFRETAHESGGL